MNEQEKKEQNKTLFLCLLFAGITYVVAQWLTTQAIADHLEYSPLLRGRAARPPRATPLPPQPPPPPPGRARGAYLSAVCTSDVER